MTVEEKRIGCGGGVDKDKIGVGIRVLAVDDNPTCLKVLEALLLKCDYQVTATNEAITALKLLRENRNNYDLIISDVNMPDMDGFKLLELVGIETDLPVIMLSVHGDKELVYKGVTHGAVDYLVKPVRIEELRNIWQHVIRRKKRYLKGDNGSPDQQKGREVVGEAAQQVASSSGMDHSSRKRKDKEEDDGASKENRSESDEPENQKKPRVVWSMDLHRKFVAAVNHLGFEKAVPKKILDLMEVEGLSRENVASHLQKYRLYLRRLSVVPAQVNMANAYGATDSSYSRIDQLVGFGDFPTLGGRGRLSSTSLSSYTRGGMFGRLNSPSGLTLQGIGNSGMLQAHSQNPSISINNSQKLHPALLKRNQATNLLPGIPSSLEPGQMQSKSTMLVGNFNRFDDTSNTTLVSNFSDSKASVGSLANVMSYASDNPWMPHVNPQSNQSRGAFEPPQSPNPVPSQNHQAFNAGMHSSNLLDCAKPNESWQTAVPLSKFPTSSPISENISNDQLHTYKLRDNVPSAGSCIGHSSNDYSGLSVLTGPFDDSRVNVQSQAGLIGNVVQNNSFGNSSSSVLDNAVVGLLDQGLDQRTTQQWLAKSIPTAPVFQHTEVEKSAFNPKMRSNEDYMLEQTKSQNGFVQNNLDFLDDMMNSMIKSI